MEGGGRVALCGNGRRTDRLRLYLGLRRRLPNGVVALFYGQVGIWTDGLEELGRDRGREGGSKPEAKHSGCG